MTNYDDPKEAATAFVRNLKLHPNASYIVELEGLLNHFKNLGKEELALDMEKLWWRVQKLEALENAGVDNWAGYAEAMGEYDENND